ncbi:MAG TPA: hypothetical protein VFL92_06825 [Sphingomonas sp.]|nr:hypothetical protein [Sphingomonas sp.]
MRKLSGLTPLIMLAACVAEQPAPPPQPAPAPAISAPALPAPPQQGDWRDVPLTPGRWAYLGGEGRTSMSQYGEPGRAAIFALRCDPATRRVIFSLAGSLAAGEPAAMRFTTSFGGFVYGAANGAGAPPSIIAQAAARDPNLDKLAFSRGRFMVEAGGTKIIVPAWPEAARVIQDCRS